MVAGRYVERLIKTLTSQIKGTVGGAQLVGFIITIRFQICFESVAFKVINRSEYNDVDFFKESSHKTSEVTRSNNNNNQLVIDVIQTSQFFVDDHVGLEKVIQLGHIIGENHFFVDDHFDSE